MILLEPRCTANVTQVVAANLGYGHTGLAKLAQTVLGVALPKPRKVNPFASSPSNPFSFFSLSSSSAQSIMLASFRSGHIGP